ncbi:MAG TPA: hypothetical protein VHM01_11145 [Alphaproteobacteria bacterium]|nr:hypothetical protein [Alphaproteobacteria bacterium]
MLFDPNRVSGERMWRDPLKLLALVGIIFIFAKVIGSAYLPAQITDYDDLVGFSLIVLLLILAMMRRMGRL